MKTKPIKSHIQEYERIGTLSIEEVFAFIAAPSRQTTINGHVINTKTLRLKSFLQNGVQCAHPGCPFKGSYFAIEKTPRGRSAAPEESRPYHLNLWGEDPEDGKPVLFTVDHIIAKSHGGLDELSNTQTMCCWHNWTKGSKEGSIIQEKRRQHRIESAPLKFTYVGAKRQPTHRAIATTVKRTLNFYLNDPLKWDTDKFLGIIWKHAGFRCIEVRLAENTYRHPLYGKGHRYDLYFVTGHGIMNGNEVNPLMRKIEADVRANMDITMMDTHFTVDCGMEIPDIPAKVRMCEITEASV
jgi:HNH endonuclease